MAGFNALSECEKRLFGFLATAAETDFYWDYDSYYKDDPEQEAGMFVRSNVAQFPPRTELRYDNMRGEKQIVSVAAVSNAVQCKYAAAILADLARRRREEDSGIAAGARPALGKETAVVLTDENLLLPLLYALPADIARRRDMGDLAGALRLIDARLSSGVQPLLAPRREAERLRLTRLPYDYPYTRPEAVALVRAEWPGFTEAQFDALLDGGVMVDYVIGVSAGIAYGVSYVSKQPRRNLEILTRFVNDRRYMGWGNFFDPRNRSYFGLKFAYDTIPNELVPFDYDTFEAYPGQVEAVVTNLQTGRAEYREVPRRDASFLLLQATCAMPVLFQPIRLDDGAPYLDGGCSDAIPWKRALAVGCDRVVVVLTRERSYRKEQEQLMPLFRRVYRKYPVFLEGLRTRAERYNQCREELFALEQEGRVLVIAPANTRGFSRTERDRQKILALWQDGFFAGRRAAEAVRDFWTRETPSAGTPE